MGESRRFRLLSDPTLRGWLAALEACPTFLPFVVDLRIAVRNELWKREVEEDALDGWMTRAVEGWQ